MNNNLLALIGAVGFMNSPVTKESKTEIGEPQEISLQVIRKRFTILNSLYQIKMISDRDYDMFSNLLQEKADEIISKNTSVASTPIVDNMIDNILVENIGLAEFLKEAGFGKSSKYPDSLFPISPKMICCNDETVKYLYKERREQERMIKKQNKRY